MDIIFTCRWTRKSETKSVGLSAAFVSWGLSFYSFYCNGKDKKEEKGDAPFFLVKTRQKNPNEFSGKGLQTVGFVL